MEVEEANVSVVWPDRQIFRLILALAGKFPFQKLFNLFSHRRRWYSVVFKEGFIENSARIPQ